MLLVALLTFMGALTSCGGGGNSPASDGSYVMPAKQGDVVIDLNITAMPEKMTYKSGEKFLPKGIRFDVVYQNGYVGDKNFDWGDLDGWLPSGPLTAEDKKVKLLFDGFEKELEITVEEKSIQNVEITREPDIKSYQVGDRLDLSGLMVKATYEEGVEENETSYTIVDKDGKVYEDGMVLEERNASLELFVTITTKGVTKQDSFIVGVFSGISIQAEAVNNELDVTGSDGYVILSGSYKAQANGTYSGEGYIGDIAVGFEMKIFVYSLSEVKGADLILKAASTCVSDSKVREDVAFNDCFQLTYGEEKTPMMVNDDLLIPGGGTSWTDWRDVNLGKVDLHPGYNQFNITCIGQVKDTQTNGPCYRAPNIDYIKCVSGDKTMLVEAESKKGVALDEIKESFTRISDSKTIKSDCTFTGDGYLGSINKGFRLDFYIYSEEEIVDADLVLIASSTCQGDGKMEDMQMNQMFAVTVDGTPRTIDDSKVVPGLPFPPANSGGNKWTNWADVDLGKITLHRGFTIVTLECIGSVQDSSKSARTPNIDRLDIRF